MSLIIREMKIKTTMKCHLKPARMATFNKSTNSTDEDVEKREPSIWENIFANDTSEKDLISKIYKEPI